MRTRRGSSYSRHDEEQHISYPDINRRKSSRERKGYRHWNLLKRFTSSESWPRPTLKHVRNYQITRIGKLLKGSPSSSWTPAAPFWTGKKKNGTFDTVKGPNIMPYPISQSNQAGIYSSLNCQTISQWLESVVRSAFRERGCISMIGYSCWRVSSGQSQF